MARRVCVSALGVMCGHFAFCAAAWGQGGEFRVTLPAGDGPVSGRLVVYLVDESSSVEGEPADGPFFDEPQPMFSVGVEGAAAGSVVVIGGETPGVESFPVPVAALKPGVYRVQAVLDRVRANSSWRREAGNAYSEVGTLRVGEGGGSVALALTRRVEVERPRAVEGVEYVEVESRILSEYRGERVVLRAGVLRPQGHVASRKYPAIYEVPGFGGDHRDIERFAMRRQARGGGVAEPLESAAFRIVLDPEGPNGHHLFADSAVNGPVGRALAQELVPELTRRFNLVDAPEGRLLRGHSSGGWSVIWLALSHPDVFGAAWSSSPDPVDFRRFQLVNIYEDGSMYERAGASGVVEDVPSFTDEGDVGRMTIRQENLMEEVLGPGNTSAQQWDSWLAVFGTRLRSRTSGDDLFDPETGVIDRAAAERMRAFDIGEQVRRNPAVLGALFKQRIRIIVGDMDNYALDEAVALLRDDLERLGFLGDGSSAAPGYLKIVPGLDHGSIFRSEEMSQIEREMMDHIVRHGLGVGVR